MVRTMINEAGKRRVKGWRLRKDVRKDVRSAWGGIPAAREGRGGDRAGSGLPATGDRSKSSRPWKPKTNVVLPGSAAVWSGALAGAAGPWPVRAGSAGFGGVPVY